MSVPELRLTTDSVFDVEADAVLLAVGTAETRGHVSGYDELFAALDATEFKASRGSFTRVFVPSLTTKPLAVVGLGDTLDAAAIREGVGAGLRLFTDQEHVAVAVLGADEADATLEGAALGAYAFDSYKTSGKTQRASTVTLSTQNQTANVDRARIVAEAMALVKDLTTTPGEWLSPTDFADAAVAAVRDADVTVDVYDEKRLAEEGFGGILGVSKGSPRAPRLVKLSYAPDGASTHIALVGKGITFDTGGLSLKPAASMVGMQEDMAGAATALAVVQAAARSRVATRLTAWLAISDNAISGSATRPGDVLRMYGGKTVEVLNTDAEGRLVLADGLAAASEEHPDLLIDVATLTGAIMVALGTRHTGVFGDEQAVQDYLAAAAEVAEDAWPMPLPAHMESELDSPIADMKNANMGSRYGGASFAGLFLQRFVGATSEDEDAPRIPWVHLDIAGSAMSESAAFGFTAKGPTGASVRSLLALVERKAS